VRALRRRPSEFGSSFPLEQLDVELESGEPLRLAFKALAWHGLDEQARLAKPRFLHDPLREPAVYGAILGAGTPGTARCYGTLLEPELERYWLFLEWVRGRELYQVGDRRLWEEAARWLGRMHARLRPRAGTLAGPGRLVAHDAAFYRRWMARAREFAASRPREEASAIEWLGSRHEDVVGALLELPRTVLHGEFYAANVLVDSESEQPRIAPVDWELAAIGPGATDLAALVSGGWRAEDRDALSAAYCEGAGVPFDDSRRRQIGFARLQLAIQWLGWAPPSWVPPEGQRHDWLTEAVALAERLGL
jgi:aminoglycoside phosphotransferase (APT) family kinase protein